MTTSTLRVRDRDRARASSADVAHALTPVVAGEPLREVLLGERERVGIAGDEAEPEQRLRRDRGARRNRAVVVRLGPVHEQRLAGGRQVEHDDAVALLDEARADRAEQPRAEVPPRAIAGRLGELEERLRAERVVVERAVELLGRALVEHARDRDRRRSCWSRRNVATRSASASARRVPGRAPGGDEAA